MTKKQSINLILFILSILLYSCNDRLGTLVIDQEQEQLSTIIIPDAGTFLVKQKYMLDVEPTNIKTSVKVIPVDNSDADAFVLIGFSDTKKKYNNISIVKRTLFTETQDDYQLLDSLGGTLFSEDDLLIHTISSDSSTLSDYYFGVCELVSTDDSGMTNTIPFNVIGVINHLDQLDFYPIEETIEFDRFTASYGNLDNENPSIRLLSGSVFKNDTIIGSLQNTLEATYSFNGSDLLQDTIHANINNISKEIRLTLTKN